jgi:hypothetical protein
MQQQYANYAQYTSADSMADCISNLTKLADRNGLRISAIKTGRCGHASRHGWGIPCICKNL